MRVVGWRFVVLAAYAFWQGGFLFYTAEVVPIGTDVLGSITKQGFVTRAVTLRMNQIGVVALAIFVVDLRISWGQSRGRRMTRALAWAGMALTLGVLFFLHSSLNQLLDAEYGVVLDSHSFYPRHRVYLWTSSLQWVLGLIYLVLGIWTWREEDRAAKTGS